MREKWREKDREKREVESVRKRYRDRTINTTAACFCPLYTKKKSLKNTCTPTFTPTNTDIYPHACTQIHTYTCSESNTGRSNTRLLSRSI